MKRILACLATACTLATSGASAQAPATPDPIGDLIAGVSGPSSDSSGDWKLVASLYHGGRGMNGHDSLGCRVSPMRTVAADRNLVASHSIIFIKETVGLPMPDGGVHDGYWYVSDIGGAIRGQRIDLFTGHNAASMRPLMALNMKSLTVSKVGDFTGCPPIDGGEGHLADLAH
ncbi:MAG TPA: 3D domain-containing protein [Caulobacteraceae bacterium]|jgi:3D (Asp-Asp-Asp) domain-containing protein|nr:3D domain-containing protein [Caulobacteraceae bacterium]